MNTVAAVVAGLALATAAPPAFAASELSGRVLFAGAAVPGATVTATRSDRTVATVSDDEGAFHFADLDAGVWTIRVEMRGFVTVSREITVPFDGAPPPWTLAMLPVVASSPAPRSAMVVAVAPEEPPPDTADVINGSVNNGAASPFAQSPALGNNRTRPHGLYTGDVSMVFGNSAWDARPFSFAGGATPAPAYGDVQIGATFGGPLKIPGLLANGPDVVLMYRHSATHNVTTQLAEMPTASERQGDFSQLAVKMRDPRTGLPFSGNVIPSDRISPQAAALLAYYPLPNIAATGGANYQAPVVMATKQDNLQLALTQKVSNRDTLAGTLAFQRTVTASASLFDFEDTSRLSTLNAALTWSRRFSSRLSVRFRYQLTQSWTNTTPFFANRTNVSGDVGVAGNNQEPANWGPPTLSFPDVAGLDDAEYQQTISQKQSGGVEASLRRGRHHVTMGGDLRRNGLDVLSQPDPRGTLTFTGAASGVPFADFLLGLPTTSALAFGTAETHLHDAAYDAYVSDDWRFGPALTMNVGVRWEYEAPFTEASERLVNLDLAPNFRAISPVLATHPVGSLSGLSYPTSLVRPDKRGFEPRLATSWRPVAGSSLVIRSSYGLYRNLGVYQPLALLLAQQPPLAKTFSVQNGPLTPLTLANPFPSSLPTTSNTFAVDSNFRTGYVHTWQASVQRDFPASLTVIAAYLGAKGGHLIQAFLPNTYPTGTENPCPACPSGFVYVTSNGSSLRNVGQLTIRRRLHNGLTASVQYTLAKSTDDAATFSNTSVTPTSLAVAQDWLNLGAERGPSSFDQRHLVSAQFQYTSGVGVAGGTLVDGLWGALFKDWTITSQLTAGSGLPLTPLSFVAVAGTGIVGVRPDLTGVPPEASPPGFYVNPAAYAAPPPGRWGDAGRDSIRGPAQFSLDADRKSVV